jgi:hypothetical protein
MSARVVPLGRRMRLSPYFAARFSKVLAAVAEELGERHQDVERALEVTIIQRGLASLSKELERPKGGRR